MKKIICSAISVLLVLCLFGTTLSAFAEGWDTDPVPFPCDEHVFGQTTTEPAGAGKDGKVYQKCKNCGEEKVLSVIPGIGSVTLSATQFYYNGKAHTPTVTVKDVRGNVIGASNYTVTYVNNKVVGKKTYAHIVFDSEKYSAAYNRYFTISLAKPVVSVKTSASAVALKWKKVAGAQYYRIYQYNTSTKKYVRVANTKNLSYTIKNKASGSTYYYLVRAYFVNANKQEFLSPYTVKDNVKAVTLCKALAVKATVSGKNVTLSWGKVTGAAYYRVFRYDVKTQKYIGIVNGLKATSYTVKNQAKGTNYYLVRAFNVAGAGSAYNTKILAKATVK